MRHRMTMMAGVALALVPATAMAGKVTRMADGSLACVEGGAMVTGTSGTWTTGSPATVGADCVRSIAVVPNPGTETWRGAVRVAVGRAAARQDSGAAAATSAPR